MKTIHKKLLYQSCYIGSKENDLIFGGFAKRYLQVLTQKELELYQDLLSHSDGDLYRWVTRAQPFPHKYQGRLSQLLIEYSLEIGVS
ncbi:MAG: hypothetical protein C0582_04425 [Alphaproteobacteria bacterium]|nr:MAG: hypothetical protein C0582_04425 [Alphaproteobacteria bacterium]